MLKKLFQKLSGLLSHSPIFSHARDTWTQNQNDFLLPLTKLEKIETGLYLILSHYSEGKFPPTFDNQRKVYDDEINYRKSLPGVAFEESVDAARRKPFWFGIRDYQFLEDFIEISRAFEALKIEPPTKVLELGCGNGWMSEFFSLMKLNVTGTTLTPNDVRDGEKRIESIRVRGISPSLKFLESPMESIHENLPKDELNTYDCIFVYEALHHAYSWQQTISSSFECLRPGGWLLICREPNLVHTLVSYRVSVLSNTHEIGFNRRKLIKHMRKTGFKEIRILKNYFGFFIKPIWLAAQK